MKIPSLLLTTLLMNAGLVGASPLTVGKNETLTLSHMPLTAEQTTAITVTGTGATIVMQDDAFSDKDSGLEISGTGAQALYVGNHDEVTLKNVSFFLQGDRAIGVHAENASMTLRQGGVHVTGDESIALLADGKADEVPEIFSFDGTSFTTQGKQSYAIRATEGNLTAHSAVITTQGDDSVGMAILGNAEGRFSRLSVKTVGAQAHAVVTSHELTLNGAKLRTEGKGAHAIQVEGSGHVTLKGGTISAEGSAVYFTQQHGLSTPSVTLSQVESIESAGPLIGGCYTEAGVVTFDGVGYAGSQRQVLAKVGPHAKLTIQGINRSNLTGSTHLDEDSALTIELKSGASWTLGQDSTVTNLVHGGEWMALSWYDAVGTTLTVNGDFEAKPGSLLELHTTLMGDDSPTDKLVIHGNTTGVATVELVNVGGTGAQTLHGIELIHVDGESKAEFKASGRIVAGAFEYTLARGHGDKAKHWYLTSFDPNAPVIAGPDESTSTEMGEGDTGVTETTDEPLVETDGAVPETPTEGETIAEVDGGTAPHRPQSLRAEAGSYAANVAAANTFFVLSREDRHAERKQGTWMRVVGTHAKGEDATRQLTTTADRTSLQVGSDVVQLGSFTVGVFGNWGRETNKSTSKGSGYRAQGRVTGYGTGVYASWDETPQSDQGAYVDTWLQYNWFDLDVKGEGLAPERLKAKGLTASVETGATFLVASFPEAKGYIEPKAQLIAMNVKTSSHREANGTTLQSVGHGNLQTKLGLKLWANVSDTYSIRPFVEAHWVHNHRAMGMRMNGSEVLQAGMKNAVQMKAGLEATIHKNLQLWGDLSHTIGSKKVYQSHATMGVRWRF